MASNGSRPSHLLLLPPLPPPFTSGALKAAYEKPVTAALKDLALERRRESKGSILEIALPIPTLACAQDRCRGDLFNATQTVVSGLYKLVCIIAARESINIEDDQGTDVRVLVLAYAGRKDEQTAASDDAGVSHPVYGSLVNPLLSLRTLARCERPWNYIIGVEGEEGEKLLRNFLTSQEGHVRIHRVPEGVVDVETDAPHGIQVEDPVPDKERVDHVSVAIGGTFDHIHVGHKLLLTMFAFVLASATSEEPKRTRNLTVGITGDELLKKKKYAELLENWDDRQRGALEFLRAIIDFRPPGGASVKTEMKSDTGPNGHAVVSWLDDLSINCVELSDPFGPTITDEGVSSLVISAETRSGGKAINDKRGEKGWPLLEVFEVDVLDANEFGNEQEAKDSFEGKLSSTTIRKQLSERLKDSTQS